MAADALNRAASDYRLHGVKWVVPGWFAQSEVHVFAGATKTGKSLALTTIAARLTAGQPFFDGYEQEPQTVAYYSTEEDYATALIPRFVAAGGNTDLFIVGDHEYDAAKHIDELPGSLAKLKKRPSMIIIDGVGSAIDDLNNNSQVRNYLTQAKAVANRTKAAVVFISHVPKGATQKYESPAEFVIGAQAWVAVPRMAIIMVRDQQVKDAKATMMIRTGNLPHPKDGGIRMFFEGVVSLGSDEFGIPIMADKLDCDRTEILEGDANALFAAANDPKKAMPMTPKNIEELKKVRDEFTAIVANSEGKWMKWADVKEQFSIPSRRIHSEALTEFINLGIVREQHGLHGSPPRTKWVAQANSKVKIATTFDAASWDVDVADMAETQQEVEDETA